MASTFRPWFKNASFRERRLVQNRLQRIVVSAEQQEESQIQRWLELGEHALQEDKYERSKREPERAA
jgi:hypothetical protein